MRKWILVGLLLLVFAGAGVFYYLTIPETVPAASLPPRTADLDNGKTMFLAGGCSSCHATPSQDDKLRLGGGLGLASPFGTFHAPNISPDPSRGIGKWSEADFVTAMRYGTSPDGRHYYPAFPYTSYARMRTDDMRDLFAYLKTLAPVQDVSKPHDLPFPFSVRRGLGLWKLAFLDSHPLQPDASKNAVWNRGAYLVEGPGHCAECHSPRAPWGAIVADKRFSGGPDPEGKGKVPNITPHADGIANWTEADIASFLADGLNPSGDVVGGSMAAVVRNFGQLPAGERQAVATYLKNLPARPGK